jgi:hypothetical protein
MDLPIDLKGSSGSAESFQIIGSVLTFAFCKTPIRKVSASWEKPTITFPNDTQDQVSDDAGLYQCCRRDIMLSDCYD